jgi:nitric oxide dioxygenase
MMPEQERLVRESWPRISAQAETAAALFYGRLFEMAPEARPLFAHVEMEAQGRKFIAMLDQIVQSLDQAPVLVTDVASLARRHTAYGVHVAQYASVGAALVWTIEQVLGDDASPEVSSAWREAYTLVAAIMARAARRSGPTAPAPLAER